MLTVYVGNSNLKSTTKTILKRILQEWSFYMDSMKQAFG